jgi:hypothetical protein
MTTATLVSMGIFFSGLVLWIANTRLASYAGRLFETSRLPSIRRFMEGMMLAPLIILVIGLLVIWFKHLAPAQPLAHLVFLLGAWMITFLGGFIFILTALQKIEYSPPALIATLIALPLAVYFIPLSNFLELFLPKQVGLGVAAGVFGVLVVELILFALRKFVLLKPREAESL